MDSEMDSELKELQSFFEPDSVEQLALQKLSVRAAALAYLDARRAKDEAAAAAKRAGEAEQDAELTLLRKLDEAQLRAVRIEDADGKLRTLTATTMTHYYLPAGALENPGVIAWLFALGGGDLVKQTVNHQSFGAFCRELAAKEAPIHAAVKVTAEKILRVTS